MTGRLSRRRVLGLVAAGFGGLAGCGYRPGGGDPRWRREVDEGVASPEDVVVAGGLLAVVRRDRTYDDTFRVWRPVVDVSAYDPATGDERWTATVDPYAGPVTARDGTMYLGHAESLTALSATDGTVDWQVVLGESPRRLVADADRVYALTHAGTLVCVRGSDGRRRWATDAPAEFGHSLTATGEGVAAVVAADDAAATVAAFDRAGRRQWSVALPARAVTRPPAVAGDVLVVRGDRRLVGLGIADGSRVWERSVGRLRGSAAVAGDVLYQLEGRGLTARSGVNGRHWWRFEPAARRRVAHPPAVASDTVYAAGRGWLRALSAADGSVRWRIDAGRAHEGPLVAGGTVVVITADGVARGFHRE